MQNSLACIDHGNNVTCTCINGYTGQNCGINFDECASNPCANGGQCIDKLNGFECRCVNNYRGAFCESKFEITCLVLHSYAFQDSS